MTLIRYISEVIKHNLRSNDKTRCARALDLHWRITGRTIPKIPPVKKHRHFKKRIMRISQEIKDRISNGIKSGKSVALIARELNIHYRTVYGHARIMGYKCSMRNILKYPTHVDHSVSERNKEILRLYDLGETHTIIAEKFKLTRERVRQICKRHNKITARDRMRLNRESKEKIHREIIERNLELKKKAKEENLLKYLLRFKEGNEMWNNGVSSPAIARHYGLSSNSIGWHMHKCRRYGMFKKRI